MTVSLTHSTPADGTFSATGATAWDAQHVLTQDTARLLGRTTAGVGATEEISVGSGLSLSAGTLSSTGGTPGGSNTQIQFNNSGVFGGASGLTTNGTSLTITGGSLIMAGNISSAAWTTNGLRVRGSGGTLTDTTSSGTVAAAYTDVFGGETVAASSAATFTNYYSRFINAPIAGTNVTFTNRWALGLNGNLSIAGSSTLTQSALGTTVSNGITLSNPTAATTGNQQNSPALRFSGNGFHTSVSSKLSEWQVYAMPIQQAYGVDGALVFVYSQAGGAIATGNIIFRNMNNAPQIVTSTQSITLGGLGGNGTVNLMYNGVPTFSHAGGSTTFANGFIQFTSGSDIFQPVDLIFGRRAAASLRLGAADTSASATVTVTIASPGVVTWTSHGLSTGTPVIFTTTGALPTGITADTTYYAIVVSANTFQIATSFANALAGTAVNTSGTQSGTHTGRRGAIAQQFGPQDTLSVSSSTNIDGADFVIRGSRSIGNKPGGSIVFQVAPAGSSGTAQNALTEALTLAASKVITVADTFDLAFSTGTGTKIATATTQKIGFWNATPIVQPTTAVAAATVAATGTGDVVAASTTFDGYTIPQIVKALRNAGLLA